MKSLLTITALFEGLTGLALGVMPTMVVSILFGTSLIDITATTIARLTGAALITIAIACWLSRNSNLSTIIVKALQAYNILSITLLVYAALGEQISGPGLWPAVFIHVALLIWCFLSLRRQVQ